MTKSLLALTVAALSSSSPFTSATTVTTLELGKSGVIHSTSDVPSTTSTTGVFSFFKSLHDISSKTNLPRQERPTQYPGLSIVPDLFHRPQGGIVIGILSGTDSEMDMDVMPTVAKKIEEGQFHVDGKKGKDLMKKLSTSAPLSPSEFSKVAASTTIPSMNKMESMTVTYNSDDAASIDSAISKVLSQLSEEAEASGSTVVVHLVVDHDSHRRRRLEDANGNNNGGDDDDNSAIKNNKYYKSMFEIQYFNITLWTALGLVGILASVNLMTMYMPLMPDTLLFGESAKMVAE